MVQLTRPSPGAVTSKFGNRIGGFHEGVDFGWGNGWTIYAAAAGTVRHAGPGGIYGARYGNLTIIDHAGFQTRYAHQSQINVRVGQKVVAGQAIGVIGGSGAKGANTYAPHLHFELLIGGAKVDAVPHFASTAGGTITPISPTIPEPIQENDMDMIHYTEQVVDVPGIAGVRHATYKDQSTYLVFSPTWYKEIVGAGTEANQHAAAFNRGQNSRLVEKSVVELVKAKIDSLPKGGGTVVNSAGIDEATIAKIGAEVIRQMKLPGN